MDWLLAALALFNLGSMYTVFVPRGVPRKAIPWVLYGFAVLATELAWVWLPLQMSLAWLLALGGALDSGLGGAGAVLAMGAGCFVEVAAGAGVFVVVGRRA